MKEGQTQTAEEYATGLLPSDAEDMMPARFPPTRDAYHFLPRSSASIRLPVPMRRAGWPGVTGTEELHRAEEFVRDDEVSRALVYRVPGSREKVAAVDRFAALTHMGEAQEPAEASVEEGAVAFPLPAPVPAWLSGPDEKEVESYFEPREKKTPSLLHETLEGSRERMASRRLGLKQALQPERPKALPEASTKRAGEVTAPLLMVFSLAGGVGKTSLVATLGRALSFTGETVLLADATTHGLLPFYYGAKDLQPSVVRRFSPPLERAGTPVHLLTLGLQDLGPQAKDDAAAESLKAELAGGSDAATVVLLDTSSVAPWALRCLMSRNTRVLIPLAPDMNSVITLGAVEKFFAELPTATDPSVEPVYLLVGFDASEALHLDVREVLRQQLSERLLPFVIRRSSAVAEALAEGMTVIDYAPEAAVSSDYMDVAQWVRSKPADHRLSRQGTLWNEH